MAKLDNQDTTTKQNIVNGICVDARVKKNGKALVDSPPYCIKSSFIWFLEEKFVYFTFKNIFKTLFF